MCVYLLVSVLLALAPPPALREPLEEEEPSESDDELLMLSLSWPRPQDVAAQPPRSGLRLRVGELSEVVSGALLSMLAMPVQTTCTSHSHAIFGAKLFQYMVLFWIEIVCTLIRNTTYITQAKNQHCLSDIVNASYADSLTEWR